MRAACVMEMFLFYNCIALTRCIYIFDLKNPAAFYDDFWYRFLSIWIRGCSVFVSGVWYYLAGNFIIEIISTFDKYIDRVPYFDFRGTFSEENRLMSLEKYLRKKTL